MITRDTSAAVVTLWREILGQDADTGASFVAAGGDSFDAVQLTVRIYEELGREIDYLDVLQADASSDIARAVEAAAT